MMSINLGKIVFVLLLFLICSLLAYLLVKNKLCSALVGICGVILIVNIWNNILTINSFSIYEVENEQIEEVVILNDWLKTVNDNVLIVMKENGYGGVENGLFDTYISDNPRICYTTANDLIYALGEGSSNLNEKKLPTVGRMLKTQKVYDMVSEIQYIIDMNKGRTKEIQFMNVEKIEVPGVKNYSIYKNLNSSSLHISKNIFFPSEVGEIVTIYSEDNIFYSQFEYKNNGKYESSEKPGYLIYGPYCDAVEGIYDILYFYDYSGDCVDGTVLGVADICMQSDFETRSVPIVAGENFVIISNVIIDMEGKGCEFRIRTNVPGVTFEKLIIEKKE